MRRRKRQSSVLVGVRGRMEVDGDERFARRTCGLYLDRLMTRFPRLDGERLEFLVWILGDGAVALAEFLLQRAPGEATASLVEIADSGQLASELTEALERVPATVARRFLTFAHEWLRQTVKELSRRTRSPVESNARAVQKSFRLTDVESSLCLFLFLMEHWQPAGSYLDAHLQCDQYAGRKYLQTALGLKDRELGSALRGRLARIGLIDPSSTFLSLGDDFKAFYTDGADGFSPRKLYAPVPKEPLPLDAHAVDPATTEHLLALLRSPPASSTHVLLYGHPGTGKTSFARGLAGRLDLPAYEIAGSDDNTSGKRRAAILACLNLTNLGPGSLVLVDEADNILNTEMSWFLRGETQDKGWLNHLLEEPGVRMLWIVNEIAGIEPSVLRRFSYSLCFKPLGRPQRAQVWDRVLRKHRARRFFQAEELTELAQRYRVSNGLVDVAVRKAVEAYPGSRDGVRRGVHLGLDASQTLLGGGRPARNRERLEKEFSLDGLNVATDLGALIGRLQAFDLFLRNPARQDNLSLNLLFHGPPGTGKSELARHLAHRVDRELKVRRSSDLVSKYVGETEQKLAEAFAEAEEEGAILVIDEADSFLSSRERAQHSWEVSAVNEFLTQMERFRGILVCTTNRLADLDPASLRRFNHKLGFDYLTPEGNEAFYRKLLLPLIPEPWTPPLAEGLRRLRGLAPGDFRVVRDRLVLEPAATGHREAIAGLAEELAVRVQQKGALPIGFGA